MARFEARQWGQFRYTVSSWVDLRLRKVPYVQAGGLPDLAPIISFRDPRASSVRQALESGSNPFTWELALPPSMVKFLVTLGIQ